LRRCPHSLERWLGGRGLYGQAIPVCNRYVDCSDSKVAVNVGDGGGLAGFASDAE